MIIERRSLLRSLLVAPFVVRAGVLMPIKPILPIKPTLPVKHIYKLSNFGEIAWMEMRSYQNGDVLRVHDAHRPHEFIDYVVKGGLVWKV